MTSRARGPWPTARWRRYRAVGDDWGVATALANRAEIALDRGQPDEAAACYREAVGVMAATGSAWYGALLTLGIAAVGAERGAGLDAARLLGSARAAVERDGGTIPPLDRAGADATLQRLVAVHGATAVDAARTEGAALDPEGVAALATWLLAP